VDLSDLAPSRGTLSTTDATRSGTGDRIMASWCSMRLRNEMSDRSKSMSSCNTSKMTKATTKAATYVKKTEAGFSSRALHYKNFKLKYGRLPNTVDAFDANKEAHTPSPFLS
jgi:hypothetical protein